MDELRGDPPPPPPNGDAVPGLEFERSCAADEGSLRVFWVGVEEGEGTVEEEEDEVLLRRDAEEGIRARGRWERCGGWRRKEEIRSCIF